MGSRAWAGRMFFGTRRLVYAGPVLPTSAHAHHAHQLVVAAPGLRLEGARGGAVEGAAFFVPANAPHAIAAGAPRGLIVLVDPDDADGRRLRGIAPRPDDAAAWRDAAAPLAGLPWDLPGDWHAAEAAAAAIAVRLAGDAARPAVQHPAVRRAVRLLPALAARGEVRLAAVAREAGVSASRLGHLFSAEVGIPMRPYVLWLRLHLASAAVAAGRTLTDAAHEAGFADSAHLSRVCRRMFGIAPSQAGLVEWVPAPAGEGMRTGRETVGSRS